MKNFVVSVIVLTAAAVSIAQNLADTAAGGSAATAGRARIVTKKTSDTTSYPYDGGRVRYLANDEDTGGQWSLTEIIEPAGYKTPLHRHPDMDEAFYVVEGTLTAKIGDRDTQEFGPGSFVLIPRGTIHAQGNLGKTPVKLLITTTPGGFEQFFADRVELFKDVKPGHPDFEKRITAVIEKNHIEVIGPWNP